MGQRKKMNQSFPNHCLNPLSILEKVFYYNALAALILNDFNSFGFNAILGLAKAKTV